MPQSKNFKTILIVMGEPFSTFTEILIKYFRSKNFKFFKNRIVIIGCKNQLIKFSKKLNYNIKLNDINILKDAKKNKINIFNKNFYAKQINSKITNKSNTFKLFSAAIK